MANKLNLSGLPLGKPVTYTGRYNPALLQSIPRAPLRAGYGLQDVLPFKGVDVWNAYEVSWLNPRGKPELAVARFEIPCASRAIIESKSLKLYLNSFNQTEFASRADVVNTLEDDLALAAGAPVLVLVLPVTHMEQEGIARPPGDCLDSMDIDVRHYVPQPALLHADNNALVRETVHSNLLRTRCPVTGQPDWGTVVIQYSGRPIDHVGLLRYIVSWREHEGFHEETIERIFIDLMAQCRPDNLTVIGRFLRRGGVDVNPYRTTDEAVVPAQRFARQ